MITITISGSHITVESTTYPSLNYAIKNSGDTITIYNRALTRDVIVEGLFSDLTLNGGTYASVTEFIVAFNALIKAYGMTNLAGIQANTDYTDTPFSSLETPVAETHVCDVVKRGWFILVTPDTNTGIVNVGPTGVGATSAGLGANQSLFVPSGDLSKWFVKSQVGADVVSVIGEYKV